MGANHSHALANNGHRHGDVMDKLKAAGMADYILSPSDKVSAPHGKPSPPSHPQATEVTSNSVSLSWQPPRRNNGNTVFAYTIEQSCPKDPKSWSVVTKSCQGNSYLVKHLQPNTQYVFRVRAENIHGVSKGSRPSEVVETKMYDVDQSMYQSVPETRPPRQAPRRHHSINLHLESSVTSILNHTDIEVITSSSREANRSGSDTDSNASSTTVSGDQDNDGGGSRTGSLQRDGALGSRSPSLQRDCAVRSRSHSLQRDTTLGSRSLSLQRDGALSSRSHSLQRDMSLGTRTNSLQREGALRSSWQPGRKRSLPILLPGTGTLSLTKLRESHTFPATRPRTAQAADSLKRREQRWSGERPVSDTPSSSSESKEDCRSCSSKEDSATDEEVKVVREEVVDGQVSEDGECDKVKVGGQDGQAQEKGDALSSPWEKDDTVTQVSDRILTAPLCDDIKMALYARSSPGTWSGVESGGADFRTLRSLLHSDDIIVRPARSLPDMQTSGSGGKKAPISNTLATIVDLEEEDESVRITTL